MAQRLEIPNISDIPSAEQTPIVKALLRICHQQQEQIAQQQEQIAQQQEQIHLLKEKVQGLRDEIARLKKQKPKPKLKPSSLEDSSKSTDKQADNPKRPGSIKRKKQLEIHDTITISPTNIPEGSIRKDVEEFTIQDIIIKPHHVTYRLERWVTPDGKTIRGNIPEGVSKGHFGPTLVSFILYQYYHAQVTQPLIWEQLREYGIDISTGQVNRIITEGHDTFHREKDEILKVGLEVSTYIHTDDTGARHNGKNGYCTHIGNNWFAWFESTSSKSRVNFLNLLRGKHDDYILNADALEYMKQKKLPQAQLEILSAYTGEAFSEICIWESFLAENNLLSPRHYQIATEGALLGSVIEHGIHPQVVIVSDDAGQFNVLQHALCWIHAERTIKKLVGFTDEQQAALEAKQKEFWEFYAELNAYKEAPSQDKKQHIQCRFDEIFTDKTCFASLNKALERLHKNKSELLLVLDRPDIPLHNNPSEQDIRDYVKKRKISGSTRSECGRRCRDTFTSLKKTCRKLGVSFWQYIRDRLSGSHKISPLSEIIKVRAEEAFNASHS